MDETTNLNFQKVDKMMNQWLSEMKVNITMFVNKIFSCAYPSQISLSILNSSFDWTKAMCQQHFSTVQLRIIQASKLQQDDYSEEKPLFSFQQLIQESNEQALMINIDIDSTLKGESIAEQSKSKTLLIPALESQDQVIEGMISERLSTDIALKQELSIQILQQQICRSIAAGIYANEANSGNLLTLTTGETVSNSEEQTQENKLKKKKKDKGGETKIIYQNQQQKMQTLWKLREKRNNQLAHQIQTMWSLREPLKQINLSLSAREGNLELFRKQLDDIRTAILSVYELNIGFILQKHHQTQQFFIQYEIPIVMSYISEMKTYTNQMVLYNSEREKMWYYEMNEEQIYNIISQYDLQKLEKLKLQMEKIYSQISERAFKHEDICKQHMQEVKYVCINEYLPEKTYLCEQCMLDIEGNGHLKHELICKRHNQSIIMIRQQQQQQSRLSRGFGVIQKDNALYATKSNNNQTFMCKVCYNQNKNRLKASNHISSCHYYPITDICIESKCIQHNTFKICLLCPNQHQGHRTVLFTRKSLLKLFAITSDDDISAYESLYLNVKEKLKLQPIKKAIDKSIGDMWKFLRFVEAFAVHSSQQSEKWVDLIMEGEKEDVLVLWGVAELKQRELQGTNKKRNFLEMLNNKLQEQLDLFNEKIVNQLQGFRERVEKLKYFEQEVIKEYLKDRYREVINTQFQGKKVEEPMNLKDIPEEYLQSIIKLDIAKEDEGYQLDRIEDNRQKALKKYKYFKKLCRNRNISKENQQNLLIYLNRIDFFYSFCEINKQWIIQDINLQSYKLSLVKSLFAQSSITPEHSISLTQSEKWINQEKNVFKYIQQKLNQFQRQLKSQSAKSSIIPQHTILLSQKLTRLSILHIRYDRMYRKQGAPFQYVRKDCSMNVFDLFEALSCLPSLRQAEVSGVYVQNIDLFIKCRRAVETRTIAKIGLSQEQSLIVGKGEWLRGFRPSLVALSINIAFRFNMNSHKFYEQAEDATMFFGLFKSVGFVSVQIDTLSMIIIDVDSLARVDAIIRCLSPLHSIKLVLMNSSQILAPLLQGLSSLTSIKAILFHNIMNIFQNDIKQIFCNNTITVLLINSCLNFPNLTNVKSLQHFKGQSVTPQFISELVTNNPNLKTVDILMRHRTLEDESAKLQQMATLENLQIDGTSFGCPVALQTLPGSSLKVLRLNNSFIKNISSQNLNNLFPKLQNLIELKTQAISFSGQLLLLIPSPHLKQIRILSNFTITNEDFWSVDCKWPYLTHLQIRKQHITRLFVRKQTEGYLENANLEDQLNCGLRRQC